jgi:type VI secretion system protein ImpH
MAGHGGRQSRSVEELLREDASRFTFLQAVRLLEQIEHVRRGTRMPPGEHIHPKYEFVLFSHAVRFDFPETDVESFTAPRNDVDPPSMSVNVLGLTGANGPLPHHMSELVLERKLRGDHAPREFLDIFNHRLISLLYRARKKYRPGIDPRGPDRGRVATVLFSLLGLGMRNLQGRLGIDDRMLLSYAGLIADQTRSAIGLERIIAHCFDVPAKVIPFEGQWHELSEESETHIGVTGRNQILGKDAALGRRVWDQSASFEVRLGPLSTTKFRSFLPGGHAHRALVSIIRFYTREELAFSIRLIAHRHRVPRTHLRAPGKPGRAYLGLTSWLKTRPPEKEKDEDDAQVTFVGRK